MNLWLVSERKADAVYQVLAYDPVTGNATLKGKYAKIEQKIDPAYLKKAGYRLSKENPNAK